MSEYLPPVDSHAELPPLEHVIRVAAAKASPLITHLRTAEQVLDGSLWLPAARPNQPLTLGYLAPWHRDDSTLPNQCYLYFGGADQKIHTTVRVYIQNKEGDLPGVALELDNGPDADERFSNPTDEQVLMCASLLGLAGDMFHHSQPSDKPEDSHQGLLGRTLTRLRNRSEQAA